VFFDRETDLGSTRAQAVYDEAASAYQNCGQQTVIIEGHTDSVGSESDNLVFSKRLALAVRDYLLARGFPKSVIEIRAFGEERPRVEAGDDGAEPENRRVEISFSLF
jgi:outer membrane protein OmpA-like peptidoglycan-associated protein